MKSIILIMTMFAVSHAHAECPVKDFDGEKILNAVIASQTCEEASNVAKNCAFGSSFDVATTSEAILICERDFDVYSAPLAGAYNTLVAACGTKYENEQGTMYRAFAAFCALSVAEFFSETYPKD